MKKDLFWSHEIASESGCSTATIRRLADSGQIECFRDGKGRRRFPLNAVHQARKAMGIIHAWEHQQSNQVG
jgi:excisionase family DNA binding protein